MPYVACRCISSWNTYVASDGGSAYFSVYRHQLRCADGLLDLAPVSHIRDERIGVIRHVHAEEAGLVCNRIARHGVLEPA